MCLKQKPGFWRLLSLIGITTLLAACTNTAAIYTEVQQLRSLTPSFTHAEQPAVAGSHPVEYTGYEEDGELKRLVVKALKADTLWVDDYFFDAERGIYYQRLVVAAADTITDCTYFFARGKCVKRWCINAEPLEEEAAEKQIAEAYEEAKNWRGQR